MCVVSEKDDLRLVLTLYYNLEPYMSVINFIWPYLNQFFDDSHSLNSYGKPLKRHFD